MDLSDIICITCGQSPVPGAPRNVGEWNDAGHEDSAHYPNWSQESFPGSVWLAHPSNAKWYGEVIGSVPGEDVDYTYGYADCDDRPDLDELIPEGWVVAEVTLNPTPQNPLWVEMTEGYQDQVEVIRDGFRFELCSECERDLGDHVISPDPLGNAHAWCTSADGTDDRR